MLRSLKAIQGYKLQATDGELGSVHDFLFDDASWTVRYLVADTSRWLAGRRVLISPAALGQPSWPEGLMPVHLTKEQIEHAPDVESDRPVSRQREVELARHYRWPEWWGAGGPVVPPMPAELRPRERTAVAEDPHLRSLDEVIGYRVIAGADKIGKVNDLIAETDDWVVRYFVVDTKVWRPGGEVLLSPAWVEHIDWAEHSLATDLSPESLRQCPPYRASDVVSRDYERSLFDYLGRPAYWM